MTQRGRTTSREQLATGEFFHIYNRGVDKRVVFLHRDDVQRFLQSMDVFNAVEPIGSIYEHSFSKHPLGRRTSKSQKIQPLVHVIAYCLNPNHFHFILEQRAHGGISEFMKRLGGGYTKYFNNKYKRSGALFQGKYKAVHIDSNEYLLYVSAYVNLNDKVHQLGRRTSKLVKSASSFDQYVNHDRRGAVGVTVQNGDVILEQFKNRNEYATYAEEALEEIVRNKVLAKELERVLIE